MPVRRPFIARRARSQDLLSRLRRTRRDHLRMAGRSRSPGSPQGGKQGGYQGDRLGRLTLSSSVGYRHASSRSLPVFFPAGWCSRERPVRSTQDSRHEPVGVSEVSLDRFQLVRVLVEEAYAESPTNSGWRAENAKAKSSSSSSQSALLSSKFLAREEGFRSDLPSSRIRWSVAKRIASHIARQARYMLRGSPACLPASNSASVVSSYVVRHSVDRKV